MKRADAPLTVKIERNKIVVSIGIATLGYVVKYGQCFQVFDEESQEYLAPKVTDPALFAPEVVRALCAEEEDGTTLVHKMFDKACEEAIEQGAEGIEVPEPREQERGA